MELPDGSFENWHSVIEKKHVWWKPWTEGTTGYWDTGNKGLLQLLILIPHLRHK